MRPLLVSSQRLLRCRHGLQSDALSPRGSRPAGVGTSHCPAGATEKREQDIIMCMLMRDAEGRKKEASKVKQSTPRQSDTAHQVPCTYRTLSDREVSASTLGTRVRKMACVTVAMAKMPKSRRTDSSSLINRGSKVNASPWLDRCKSTHVWHALRVNTSSDWFQFVSALTIPKRCIPRPNFSQLLSS